LFIIEAAWPRATSQGAEGKNRMGEGKNRMGFEQYHEPANELSEQSRTFARMIVSMTEEFKHFGMDLEFLLRQKPKWRATLQDILFKDGDIVGLGEHGERDEDRM
jgi:uncharacterized protein